MRFALLAVLAAGLPAAFAAPGALHLMQKPDMNKTAIVFSYAGDLWTVSRQGGAAQRLTSGPGFETDPAFSPDGNTIAFSGEYDGNTDVFTVPATGVRPACSASVLREKKTRSGVATHRLMMKRMWVRRSGSRMRR